MRSNRKTRLRRSVQIGMALATAVALPLGLAGSASAADGTGAYRVYVTNIRFSFTYIDDCDLICSDVAEPFSSKIMAYTEPYDYFDSPHDEIAIGSSFRDDTIDVTQGHTYAPSTFGYVSQNGWKNNVMSFRVNSKDVVRVGEFMWDADNWSNDDVMCDTVNAIGGTDSPDMYTNFTAWKGPRNVVRYSTKNSDGQCRLSYTINVVPA